MALRLDGNWGAERSQDYVHDLPDPEPMGSRHHPTHHRHIEEVTDMALEVRGLEARNKKYLLSNDNKRMLLTFDIAERNSASNMFEQETYKNIGAIINPQDQSAQQSFLVGTDIYVCTNLTFSAEFRVQHKSTLNGLMNMRNMMFDAIPKLEELTNTIRDGFDEMRQLNTSDEQAAHFIMQAARGKPYDRACAPRDVVKVMDAYLEPDHAEFRPRNMYSLYNAFTGFYQDANPFNVLPLSRSLNKKTKSYISSRKEFHDVPTARCLPVGGKL